MDEQTFSDFVSALCEEFTTALCPPIEWGLSEPHDGYEVWLRAFKTKPSPAALAALTAPAIEHLRAVLAAYCECPAVSAEHVECWISGTLARWPAEDD